MENSLIATLSNEAIKKQIKDQKGEAFLGIGEITIEALANLKKAIKENKSPYERRKEIINIMNTTQDVLTNMSFGADSLSNEDARKIIFQTIATEFLFPENYFIDFCQEDTILAEQGQTMVLPQFINKVNTRLGDPYLGLQSGQEIPLKNPVALTGDKIEYAIELFTADPIGIGLNELSVLPYDKTIYVMEALTRSLATDMPDFIINKWALPTNDIAVLRNDYLFFETTGGTRLCGGLGYTGTVNGMSIDDIRKVKMAFAKNQVHGKIHALASPEVINDLLLIMTPTTNAIFMGTGVPVGGYVQALSDGSRVVEFEGITFHERQSVQGANVYYDMNQDGKYVKIEYREEITVNSLPATIFWNENYVRKALQAPIPFILNNYPQSLGMVVSMSARVGSSRWRQDFKGVVTLVEKKVG